MTVIVNGNWPILGNGDSQTVRFGAYFGGAAVACAFAGADIGLGAGIGAQQHHAAPKLALVVDDRGPILFGKIDQLFV